MIQALSSLPVQRHPTLSTAHVERHPTLSTAQALSSLPMQRGPTVLSSLPVKRHPTLSHKVKGDLLRGIRVERLLYGCGSHWAPAGSRGRECAIAEYEMSERVGRLDDFVTHDWGTGRWPKLLSLMVHYNSGVASLASILAVSLVFLILLCTKQDQLERQEGQDERYFDPCEHPIGGRLLQAQRSHGAQFVGLGIAVFWFFLFFWQNLKSLLFRRRPRFVFVDKFCIHQMDETLKREGILALAGFLRRSDRLVVLWSPRYFHRLWCSYEMATWVHTGRDFARTVDFIPVDAVMGIVVIAFVIGTMDLIGIVAGVVVPDQDVSQLEHVALIMFVFVVVFVAQFFFKEVHELDHQLENFSIQDAKCFCCANEHRHPVTGMVLPCDRALIYSTLDFWSSPSHKAARCAEEIGLEYSLAALNVHVQTSVRDVFAHQGFFRLFSYKHGLILSIPIFCMMLGFSAAMDCPFALQMRARMVLIVFSRCLCHLPCIYKIGFWVIYTATRHHQFGIRLIFSLMVAVCVIVAIFLTDEYGSVPWHSWLFTHNNSAPLLLSTAAEVFVTFLFFRNRTPRYVPHPNRSEDLMKASTSGLSAGDSMSAGPAFTTFSGGVNSSRAPQSMFGGFTSPRAPQGAGTELCQASEESGTFLT